MVSCNFRDCHAHPRRAGAAVLVLLNVSLLNTVAETQGQTLPPRAVRCLNPILAQAVREGRRRSMTFQRLMDHLEPSGLVVYLGVGSCPAPQSIACLSMMGSSRSNRFVRITLVMQAHGDKTRLAVFANHLIAQIGHELQHAVEIADAPSVVDTGSLDAAYRLWGFLPDPKITAYESPAAIEAGQAVLNELQPAKKRNEKSDASDVNATVGNHLRLGSDPTRRR